MENTVFITRGSNGIGLAFAPMTAALVYYVKKADLHSFTISLRYQLAESNVDVIEVILHKSGLHKNLLSPEDFVEAIFAGFKKGGSEIGFGTSQKAMNKLIFF